MQLYWFYREIFFYSFASNENPYGSIFLKSSILKSYMISSSFFYVNDLFNFYTTQYLKFSSRRKAPQILSWKQQL